jgi:NhaP-type Na+/H+ and K+/H+ antiporter
MCYYSLHGGRYTTIAGEGAVGGIELPLQIIVVAECLSGIAILILDGTLSTRLYTIRRHQLKTGIALAALGIGPHDEEGVTAHALSRVVAEGTLRTGGVAYTAN